MGGTGVGHPTMVVALPHLGIVARLICQKIVAMLSRSNMITTFASSGIVTRSLHQCIITMPTRQIVTMCHLVTWKRSTASRQSPAFQGVAVGKERCFPGERSRAQSEERRNRLPVQVPQQASITFFTI